MRIFSKTLIVFLLFCCVCFGQEVQVQTVPKKFYRAENIQLYGENLFSAENLDPKPRLGTELEIKSSYKEEPLVEAWNKNSNCDSIDLQKLKKVEGDDGTTTHVFLLIGSEGETWIYQITFYVEGKWIRKKGEYVFPGKPTDPPPVTPPDKNVYTELTKKWMSELDDNETAVSLGIAYVNLAETLKNKTSLSECQRAVQDLTRLIMLKRPGDKPWHLFLEALNDQFEKDNPDVPNYLATIKSVGQILKGN